MIYSPVYKPFLSTNYSPDVFYLIYELCFKLIRYMRKNTNLVKYKLLVICFWKE